MSCQDVAFVCGDIGETLERFMPRKRSVTAVIQSQNHVFSYEKKVFLHNRMTSKGIFTQNVFTVVQHLQWLLQSKLFMDMKFCSNYQTCTLPLSLRRVL